MLLWAVGSFLPLLFSVLTPLPLLLGASFAQKEFGPVCLKSIFLLKSRLADGLPFPAPA